MGEKFPITWWGMALLPIQVVLHPALRQPFEEWLASRDLRMGQIPTDDGDLPTFIVIPEKSPGLD